MNFQIEQVPFGALFAAELRLANNQLEITESEQQHAVNILSWGGFAVETVLKLNLILNLVRFSNTLSVQEAQNEIEESKSYDVSDFYEDDSFVSDDRLIKALKALLAAKVIVEPVKALLNHYRA